MEENRNFILTYEQAKDICTYYDEDIEMLEEWEVAELLDRLIDETLYAYGGSHKPL